MSIIEKEEIVKVAHLARLAITNDKVEEYTSNVSHILKMVEKMDAVDVDGVEPLASPLDSTLRLRPDVVTAEIDREAFQAMAPNTENGLYLVPKVIE
jgi:aspartyl-tRNA(Asn)/glutamyl-tRNA(Gln) amidotransferase subunit C